VVVYLVNRYGVLLQASLNLVAILDYNLDIVSCENWNLFSNWSIPAVMCCLEATLALRVVALWLNKRIIKLVVWTIWLLATAAMFVLMGLSVRGSYGVPSPDPPVLGCQISGTPTMESTFWLVYLPSIIFETVVAGLTLSRAIHHRKVLQTAPLLLVLVRDGFLYFMIVLALMSLPLLQAIWRKTVAKFPLNSLQPILYSSWFPHRAHRIRITLSSLVAVRLFLNLRQVAEDCRGDSDPSQPCSSAGNSDMFFGSELGKGLTKDTEITGMLTLPSDVTVQLLAEPCVGFTGWRITIFPFAGAQPDE